MQSNQQSQSEADFYQAIDKAARAYKQHGNINGYVIRRNLANGEVCLGVGEDQENGIYATKAITEKEMNGKVSNSRQSSN